MHYLGLILIYIIENNVFFLKGVDLIYLCSKEVYPKVRCWVHFFSLFLLMICLECVLIHLFNCKQMILSFIHLNHIYCKSKLLFNWILVPYRNGCYLINYCSIKLNLILSS